MFIFASHSVCFLPILEFGRCNAEQFGPTALVFVGAFCHSPCHWRSVARMELAHNHNTHKSQLNANCETSRKSSVKFKSIFLAPTPISIQAYFDYPSTTVCVFVVVYFTIFTSRGAPSLGKCHYALMRDLWGARDRRMRNCRSICYCGQRERKRDGQWHSHVYDEPCSSARNVHNRQINADGGVCAHGPHFHSYLATLLV